MSLYVLRKSEEYTAAAQADATAESCGMPAGTTEAGGWTMHYVNCGDSDVDDSYVTVDVDDVMLSLKYQRPTVLGSFDWMAGRDLLTRLLQQ